MTASPLHYLEQREDLNDEIFAFKNKPEGINLGFIAAKLLGII